MMVLILSDQALVEICISFGETSSPACTSAFQSGSGAHVYRWWVGSRPSSLECSGTFARLGTHAVPSSRLLALYSLLRSDRASVRQP